MRLDKFLSNNTSYSRSQIHKLIRLGDVRVNGNCKLKPDQKILESDEVYLDNQLITARTPRYLMLNKPAGYVCATSDSEHPTVMDLLDEDFLHELQIVGRLDKETTGLLLLTDDGPWNHRITAPVSQCTKTYRVDLADPISPDTSKQFQQGVLLDGEKKLTAPAKLDIVNSHQAYLTISEGKYHQVKRMFAAVGNRVTGLHREKIGELQLDSQLAPGAYRPLTEQEKEAIFL
jgi:16S rRNA pseudouridine516 synthase